MSGENHPPKTGDARILWDLDRDQFDALLTGDRELLRWPDVYDTGDSERETPDSERETANYKCPACGGALISTDMVGMYECIRCGETVREQDGETQ